MTKTLLIVGHVWPEPSSSAAGSRMLQLMTFFNEQKYDITFATTCSISDYAFDLNAITVAKQVIKLNDSSFDDFILKLQPDVVLFDRFMTEEQFGWRVAEQLPNAIRVLNTEDLHFLRKGRQEAHKKQVAFSDSFLINDTAKREIASIYRCDLSLIISSAEIELLQNHFKVNKQLLFYLPFLIEPISEAKKDQLPTFEERHHFVTIGNFLHPPNFDALVYLKETIWPLIREKLPNAELHNYGAYVSQKVQQLHDASNGFLIRGRAVDAHVVISNARVLLAPLRFGAGLKGKIFDAMQNGTPYVTTAVGAEGILDNETFRDIVGNDAETYVSQGLKLYHDKTNWQHKQNLGFEVLATHFLKAKFETSFVCRISELTTNLKKERQHNFTGQMLMHHTLQSTKYMGKWIEAKNL